MYLINSDYLIDFLRAEQKATQTIASLAQAELVTSVICVAEILEGFYYIGKEEHLKNFRELPDVIHIWGINMKIANQFARIRSRLRAKGQLIDNFDLLIAATCRAYDFTLLTNNLTHYQRIPGLKIHTL